MELVYSISIQNLPSPRSHLVYNGRSVGVTWELGGRQLSAQQGEAPSWVSGASAPTAPSFQALCSLRSWRGVIASWECPSVSAWSLARVT